MSDKALPVANMPDTPRRRKRGDERPTVSARIDPGDLCLVDAAAHRLRMTRSRFVVETLMARVRDTLGLEAA